MSVRRSARAVLRLEPSSGSALEHVGASHADTMAVTTALDTLKEALDAGDVDAARTAFALLARMVGPSLERGTIARHRQAALEAEIRRLSEANSRMVHFYTSQLDELRKCAAP